MPLNYTPSLPVGFSDHAEVAEWARKELELLGRLLTEAQELRLQIQAPPSAADAAGRAGQIIFGNDGYIYFCSATDTWLRLQPVTWP